MRALLRGAILFTAIGEIARGDVLYGVFCLGALAVTTALAKLARSADTSSPVAIDIVLLWLMVSDMTVGNLLGLYLSVHWYDKALHLGSSTLIGLLGFLFIYMVHVTGRMRLHPWLDGVLILVVTLGLGAAWEVAEYAVDRLFARASQGAPGLAALDDTMIDLALDGVGGVLAAIIGPLYMRNSARSRRRVQAIAKVLARREHAPA